MGTVRPFDPVNAKSNPIRHLLALLGAHHILHISKVRVKLRNYRINFGGIVLCALHGTLMEELKFDFDFDLLFTLFQAEI